MKAQSTTEDLTRYVDPLIGTKEIGHIFPGASVPFGMVQISPDNDTIPYAVNGKYTGTVTVIVPGTSATIKNDGCKNNEEMVYKGFWRKSDQKHNFPEMAGQNLKAYFDLSTAEGEKVKTKFALLAVSIEGALKNLEMSAW